MVKGSMRQGRWVAGGVRVSAILAVVAALCVTLVGGAVAAGVKGAGQGAPPPALSGRIQSGPWYDSSGEASWVKLRVPVELIDTTGAVRGAVVPDKWGEFRFSHVAPGTYRVRFTYPAYHDATPTRTWISQPLVWTARTAWQVLVDIDPYLNSPSYQLLTETTRCPAAVPANTGCNR